ncbi:MAG: hypothetical protein AAF721_30045 [Myxococcota bacterium]
MPYRCCLRLFALVALAGGPGCTAKKTDATSAAEEKISPVAEPKVDVGTAEPTAENPPRRGLAALTQDVVAVAQEKPDDPFALIPARAEFVVQFRVAALYGVSGFSRAVDFVADKADDKTGDVLAAMAKCELPPAKIESVTVAMDEVQDGVMVVRGPGVGDPDRWRCVRTEMVTAGHTPKFEIKSDGDKPVLYADEDVGFFVDDDTFVFSDDKLENEVTALIEGKETRSMMQGELASIVERVNMDEPVWFAMNLTPDQRKELASTPMDSASAFWGALSTGEELALSIALLTPSEDAAVDMRSELEEQWDQVKGMAGSLGVPSAVSSSVSFEATAGTVVMKMRATPEEIETIATKIGAF